MSCYYSRPKLLVSSFVFVLFAPNTARIINVHLLTIADMCREQLGLIPEIVQSMRGFPSEFFSSELIAVKIIQ